MSDPLRLRFGSEGRFELDEARFEVREGGEPIPLEPKPLALLLFLARHRDRLVRREELYEALWPGIVVSDHALSRAVFKVRTALGEESNEEGSVRTVRGVGFRFVAPVSEEPEPAAPAPAPSPARPAPPPRMLVGREEERVQLSTAFATSLAGRGGLVLIEGEPGIGKTRIAEALAEEAEHAGAFVHWARARKESGAPALWLWVQVLRSFVQADGIERIERWLGREALELARVNPELSDHLGTPPGDVVSDGDGARFRLHDALAQLLTRSAVEEPQVLMLEDLQWADASSLRALAHVTSAIGRHRVLLVGTLRSDEPTSEVGRAALAAVVAEATRSSSYHRIVLQPLERPEVEALFESQAGFRPAPELGSLLQKRTRGNPYFVIQLAAHAVQSGGDEPGLAGQLDATPPEIRAAVRQRLEALSSGCREALSVAAVIGRDFPVSWVARAARQGREELVDSLGEAVRAGIIGRAESGGLAYHFVHDLQREVIAADLSEREGTDLHRRVGEAIRTLHEGRRDAVMPDLAYHFTRALPLVDGALAVEFAKRAGELARDSYAFEEAADYFRQAYEALDWLAEPAPALGAELLIGEGFALQGAGHLQQGRAVLEQAIEAARHARQPGLLAVAVMGVTELGAVGTDPTHVAMLEEALHGLDANTGPLRIWLLTVLALHMSQIESPERGRALADEAVELSQGPGRESWLAFALSGKAAVSRLEPDVLPEQRLELLDRSIAHAQTTRARSFELLSAMQRYGALLELARRDEAEAELDHIGRLVEEMRSSYWSYVLPARAAGLRFIDGDLAEAERLAMEAFDREEGPKLEFPAAKAGMVAEIRYQQGRLGALAPIFAPILEQSPGLTIVRAAELQALLDAGDEAKARDRLDALAADDFRDVVGRESWVLCLCILAEACSVLRDRGRAAELRRWLEPRAEHVAILANGHYAHGPVALYLGLLAHCLEDWEALRDHSDRALRVSDRLRSPIWRASALALHASLALGRGEPARALQLARETFGHTRDLSLPFARLRRAALEEAQR